MDSTWSIIATIVSIVAALFAFSQAWSARKSYKLMKEQDERRNPKIIISIQKSFKHKLTNSRIIAFELLINNRSENNNAITSIGLKIRYKKKTKLIDFPLSHNPNIKEFINKDVFYLPEEIGSNSSISKWALFEISEFDYKKLNIENYCVYVYDSHGIEYKREQSILIEVQDYERV